MKVLRLIFSALLTALFALLSAAAWYGWHTAGGYSGGLLAFLTTAAAVGWYRCFMLDYQTATDN